MKNNTLHSYIHSGYYQTVNKTKKNKRSKNKSKSKSKSKRRKKFRIY